MKPFYVAAALALLFGLTAAPVPAQEIAADEIIRIETTLVSVPVIVSDRDGRYLPNLKSGDFKIYQDGTEQKIELFAAEEEPLSVALVLDTSPSTAGVLGKIKSAATKFTKILKPEDRAMVISFDTSITFLSPLTSNRAELERAIRSARVGPFIGTVMRDAVRQVIEQGFKNVKGRKAIILLTDGQDFGSLLGESDLLDLLQESDVMIYSIQYKTDPGDFLRPRGVGRVMGRGGPPGGRFPGRRGGIMNPRGGGRGDRRDQMKVRTENAAKYLKEMSELTAGRFYNNDLKDLAGTFASIADELRMQYRIGFYPSSESQAGQVHQIKVAVDRQHVSVRARNSYRTAR